MSNRKIHSRNVKVKILYFIEKKIHKVGKKNKTKQVLSMQNVSKYRPELTALLVIYKPLSVFPLDNRI